MRGLDTGVVDEIAGIVIVHDVTPRCGGVVDPGLISVGAPDAALEPELRHASPSLRPSLDDVTPAAVAFCASAADVQRCVGFARTHGIRPMPRCGGHSYGRYSTGPGLVVDVTPMNTPNLVDWQRAYYGTNLGRLVSVKAAYDPDDVFHFAQSIPTRRHRSAPDLVLNTETPADACGRGGPMPP